MNWRKLISLLLLCCSAFLMLTMVSCGTQNKSEKDYWFSDFKESFVPYDDDSNNLDEAGTHWEMTLKRDCAVTLSFRIDTDSMSTAYLYLNGEQVKSEPTSDSFYSFIYKDLTLKKGDTLKFHAFWVNSLAANDTGFAISVFGIDDGTQNYSINISN